MRGFTIVEALICIAIAVILIAIAVPAYQCASDPTKCPRDSGVPGYNIVTDPANGCEYLASSYTARGPLTPRLGPDGKQICRQVER